MAKEHVVMRGSTGLNTVDDPVRIQYDSESGMTDLAVAVNVTLTKTGRLNRRKGQELRIPIFAHSLFCDEGEAVFVHESSLYLLESSFAYRAIAPLTSNERMAYAQVGDRIYCTNDHDMKYVEDGVCYDWRKDTDYVGPVTQRVFEGPPHGNHLAYHGGRIYVSDGPVLWYSEYQAHSWFDMARNFIWMPSHIRMIKPVAQGLFVSTDKKIYFLKGLVPKTFEQYTLTSYPALEWSDSIEYVSGVDIPEYEIVGTCPLWTTPEGAMMGTPTGGVINLNKKKVIYPQGNSGCSMLQGLNFIHTVE